MSGGAVTTGSTRTFLHVTGEALGRGVFTSWSAAGRVRLAEAGVWRVYEERRDADGNPMPGRGTTRRTHAGSAAAGSASTARGV